MTEEIGSSSPPGAASTLGPRSSISKIPRPQPVLNTVKKEKKPSLFKQSIRAIFGFRKTSLTLFVILTYALVLLLVAYAKDKSLSIPTKETHILETSWLDLQNISNEPHPYVSHSNDHVHDYILKRVTELSSKNEFITISDDAKENLRLFEIIKSWFNSTSDYSPLHYFESSNILVKLEGQDPTLDGLLLSSHFDSVPTAYGTTDDGTGVAAMLGVLEHYATAGVRPLRTIVFNFNNNEEFGLFGAEAFVNHPWKDLVKYVINLEGTGTGERAVLFRTSDYDIAQFYQKVRSPFGTSIFQQGFASGFVHSETDYRVYVKNGLRGVDIAFYKPRSLYHTAKDSIRFSSKNALWHMLSNTLDLTNAISNAKTIGEDTETKSVYFDILGLYFVIVPLDSLIVADMALLTIVPIVLILFGLVIHRRKIWDTGFSWFRIFLSVLISAFATKALADTIYFFNPFVVSRDFYSPLLALSSTFLFINYLLLTISDHLWPVHDFKLIITLEFFIALWALLLYSTIQQSKSNVYTGEYLITIIYTLYSISVFLGLFSISIASYRKEPNTVTHSSYGSIKNHPNRLYPSFEEEEQPTNESSRLLSNNISASDTEEEDILNHEGKFGHPEHNSFTYDWSLQFLILVPINFLLTYLSVTLVLEAINQTIQESLESNYFVFAALFVSSIALTAPLVSFSYKLNYFFGLLLLLSIVISIFNSLFEPSFTPEAPLKFRFAQTINLDTSSPQAKVEVYGREGFLSEILKDLPSIKTNDRKIDCEPQSDGNELCKYVAKRPYLVDGTSNDLHSYLTVNVLKSSNEESPYAPLTAELEINAKSNRYCSLTFNSTTYKSGYYGKSPLRIFTYYHDKYTNKTISNPYNLDTMASVPSGPSKDANGNEVFKFLAGIDAIHLHKLNWDQDSYHIGLQWIPKWLEDGEEQEPADSPNNKLGISVSCYWGEYDGTSIIDGESKRILPAYDELLQYTPRSTSFSNRYEGLVKVERFLTL